MSIYFSRLVYVIAFWGCCVTESLSKDKLTFNYTVVSVSSEPPDPKYKTTNGESGEAAWKQYCPSHCGADGKQKQAYNCIYPPYCCNMGTQLKCCQNATLVIDDDVIDGHNCSIVEYWQIVLSVCVPLATLSLILFLAMTAYLMCRRRRDRQARQRSGSDVSCSSWSGSTVSPANTLRGGHSPYINPPAHRGRTIPQGVEIFSLELLYPPPYLDKPPPYTTGEPNSGFENSAADGDSLPDYESIILDPRTLASNNVLMLDTVADNCFNDTSASNRDTLTMSDCDRINSAQGHSSSYHIDVTHVDRCDSIEHNYTDT